MDVSEIVLIISQIAGIILLILTILLLWFRKIYIDSETKQTIQFELPILGKIKSQSPVFSIIVIAAFLVLYPITQRNQEMISIDGKVDMGNKAAKSVSILGVAQPNNQVTVNGTSSFHLTMPKMKDVTYHVKFIDNMQILGEKQAVLCGKSKFKIEEPFNYEPPIDTNSTDIKLKKEVSDEVLHRLNIH